MAGDDIIDAEWEEVPDHGGKLHVARTKPTAKAAPRQRRRGSKSADASPWLSFDFWSSLPWRNAFLLIIVLLVLIAILPEDRDKDAASPTNSSTASAAVGADAQNVSSWSQAVIGKPSTLGFTLVDGGGKPGEFCNSSSGTSLMNFGGRTLPPEHADMYNYFGWLHANSNVGIVGFFRFDADAGELVAHDLIEGNTVTDRHHDIKDKRMKVAIEAPGIVDIDGTRYHVCVL